MSKRQQVVDVPFRHPNCLGSILSPISLIIQETTKSSKTLHRQDVSEIDLVSLSQVGCCFFGIGIISESFQILGTDSDASDMLKIFVIGSASS